MSLTFTPFPMYDFPELAEAHDTYWAYFSALVRRGRFSSDIPLTQICGYPLATALRHTYDVIAAPVYEFPYCEGATHCGLIVAGVESSYVNPSDLRGARFALNAWDSNTGMNLARHLVAPFAQRGSFFGSVVETGSHLASIDAIRNGEADVASIDNVTFAVLAKHRPSAVDGVRVLTRTFSSPTIPFVVPSSRDIRMRTLLYDSLAETVERLRDTDAGRALQLVRVERASLATYDPLLELEREAAGLGYGTLQ